MKILWKHYGNIMEISWYGWAMDRVDAWIWYLIIGFVFSKGAVSATPDDIIFIIDCEYGVAEELLVGFEVSWGCLVNGDVHVWCLVYVVWYRCLFSGAGLFCLLSGDVWVSHKSTFPSLLLRRFSQALSGTLVSPIVNVTGSDCQNGMPMLMWYCDLTLGVTAQESTLGELWFEHSLKREIWLTINWSNNFTQTVIKTSPLPCQWAHQAPPCSDSKRNKKQNIWIKTSCSCTRCGWSRPPGREWRRVLSSRWCNPSSFLPEKAKKGAAALWTQSCQNKTQEA